MDSVLHVLKLWKPCDADAHGVAKDGKVWPAYDEVPRVRVWPKKETGAALPGRASFKLLL